MATRTCIRCGQGSEWEDGERLRQKRMEGEGNWNVTASSSWPSISSFHT